MKQSFHHDRESVDEHINIIEECHDDWLFQGEIANQEP